MNEEAATNPQLKQLSEKKLLAEIHNLKSSCPKKLVGGQKRQSFNIQS